MRHKWFLFLTVAVLLSFEETYGQDLIVPFNSITKYDDNFQEPANQGSFDWTDLNYNDSPWSSGPGQLGYGDGDEATVINTVLTGYFRKSFTLPNLCNYSELELTLIIDDGAIVYVNGVEVDRFNMNSGAVNYNTFANTTVTNNAIKTATVSTALLNSGNNVIAVEIHQRNATSSDISYDLQVEGMLSANPCTCVNGMILDVDNDGICDDIDSCIGSNCEMDLNQFSLCSRININQIANDLSGVAYNDDQQRLVVVENGTPRAYELDLSGNVIRTLILNNFEDTEGIAYAGNNQYFIVEERKRDIVLITVPVGNNNIAINHPGNGSRISLSNEGNDNQNDGLEGVTYDRANDVIYAVKELANMEVYEINNAMSRLGTNYFAPTAFNVTSLASTYPGNFTDLAGISLTSFGTLLLLTEEGDHVVEVDPATGSFISNLNLAPSNTPQPEGLTVISNGEIIVVGESNEFLTYKSVGGSCNDNNACTINDVVDSNCNCTGTNQDSDNDGVCDGLDSCPNLNNALIGTSCSDGDACTINDVWQSNCLCAGVLLDTDNDGICDGLDSCPTLNNNLIGQPCNDGNANTTGDTWQSNCTCVGTGVTDSDGDGVPDSSDQCPNFDDSLIGQACSDGNICTSGDVYTSNCQCVGTPVTDSDNDGLCDSIDSCPNLNNSLIGQPCNDGNASTTGDTWQSNCTCVGTGSPDSDGDGIPDSADQCPNFNDNLIGQPCDDGDSCTTGDVFTSSCQCDGTAVSVNQSIIEISPEDDAYLRNDDVFNNSFLRVSNGIRESYLKFDLSGIAEPISSIELELTTQGDAGSGSVFVYFSNSTNWTESNLNSSNAPGLDVFVGLFSGNFAIGTSYRTLLSGINSGGVFSLIMVMSANSNDVAFASNEYSVIADRPKLIVTTTENCGDVCENVIIENDNDFILTNLVEATSRIETNRILLSPLTSTYQAGQSVELKAGFEVQDGATFTAQIQSCQ